LQQGARARAPPPTGTCPNARRPHSAARPLLSEGSGGATCDDEGLNDREEDEDLEDWTADRSGHVGDGRDGGVRVGNDGRGLDRGKLAGGGRDDDHERREWL
jgi:hypothetical protein